MAAKPTLDAVPPAPKSDDCKNAWLVLKYAHETAESFLKIFSKGRSPGQPSRPEQDLLRAMLVFASAGLDSMIKHLVKDALPTAIKNDPAIHDIFLEKFVERKIKQGEQPDYKIMADVLVAENPIDRMITMWVNDLTAKSLQSEMVRKNWTVFPAILSVLPHRAMPPGSAVFVCRIHRRAFYCQVPGADALR